MFSYKNKLLPILLSQFNALMRPLLMINLTHLKSFVVVAKTGSFTRGAYNLNITQPAVSGHISALEEDLGTKLFNRTGKKIVLTPAGELVMDTANEIFSKLEQLNIQISKLSEFKGGTVNLGASKIIGTFLLPKLAVAFRKKYSDICVNIHIHSAHTIITKVIDNQLDLAITSRVEHIPDAVLGSKVICQDQLVAITTPDSIYAKRPVLTLSDMRRESFILPGRQTASFFGIRNYFSFFGINLQSSMELGSAGAIKRAVEESKGLGLISKSAVLNELANGQLVEMKMENVDLRREILMIWRHDRSFSKSTEAFVRFLLENWNLTSMDS